VKRAAAALHHRPPADPAVRGSINGQVSNWFSKFSHDHSINKLAYGFGYDDVGGFSP
jgi:glycosyl hydrolase family 64 (putative beta-1,3-glucanase)